MAGEWDVVEEADLVPPRRVERQMPFNPVSGPRNALMPPTMKVLATTPPRPSASNRITFRDATPEEQAQGILQVDSRGKKIYAPKSMTGRPVDGSVAPMPKLAPQDNIFLTKLRTSANEMSKVSADMDEFVRLNKNVDTGGAIGALGLNSILKYFDSDRSTMTSITDKLTPAMRNGLPGAASDKDVAMFRSAAPSPDKPLTSNRAIATSAKAFASRNHDYMAYMEAYARKHGGLLGAQEEWDAYSAANPIYEEAPDKDNVPVPRKSKPWREYFPELKPTTPGKAKPKEDPLGLFGGP